MLILEKGRVTLPVVERQSITSLTEVRPETRRRYLNDGPKDSAIVVVQNYYTEGSKEVGPVGILLARGMYELGPDVYFEGVQHVSIFGDDITVTPYESDVRLGFDGSYFAQNGKGPIPNRNRVPYKLWPITNEDYNWFSDNLVGNPADALDEMYELLAEEAGFVKADSRGRPVLIIPEYYASLPLVRQTL